MFTELTTFLSMLSSLSPLAVIALLGTIILLMVHKKGPIKLMTDNHLTHVSDSLKQIADNSDKQVDLLNDIKNDTAWLKGKLS